MDPTETIRRRTHELTDELVQIRRTIHQNPELGFEEHETAALVAATLGRLGIPIREGVGGTGVVGIIEGGAPGKTVAVRAELDCLPIHEETNLPYASRNPGKMHACGHDLHTAIALGVAHVVHELRAQLRGRVKLVFQPAEEKLGGAHQMIADGVLEDPPVDAIVGFHNWPVLEAGKVGYTRGIVMASSDMFEITLKGVSGHAAHPHTAVDAVTGAAYFVTQLQSIVSREIAPISPAVVSVGQINGGTAPNILPDTVHLRGTVRTLDPHAKEHVGSAMRRLLDGLKTGMRVDYALDYRPQVPILRNDDALLDRVVDSATATLGRAHVDQLVGASMGAEDFACFAERVPGAFIRVGSLIEGHRRMLHNSDFQPNELAIPTGVQVVSRAVVDLLS